MSAVATTLVKAAAQGNTPLLERWERNRINIRAIRDVVGRSLLHIAASNGHPETVRYLLNIGAHPDARDDQDHATPVHCAAAEDKVECLAVLDSYGARMDIKDIDWWRPLHWAMKNGHFRASEYLLKTCEASATEGDGNHLTPLHLAVQHNEEVGLPLLKLLFQYGAVATARNTHGYDPLCTAAKAGSEWAIAPLVSHGANVDGMTKEGFTPLHNACILGNLAVVTALLKCGANIHAATRDGDTPLHIAAGRGRSECLELLLQYGAQAQIRNGNGQTAFHVLAAEAVPPAASPSAAQRYLEAVKMLIRWRVDPHAKDSAGRTVLQCAKESQHKELIETIAEYESRAPHRKVCAL